MCAISNVSLIINKFSLRKIYNFISKFLLFGFILRYIIEGYLELAVLCFLNMKCIIWDNTFNRFTSILAITILAIVILFPFLMPSLLYMNRENFDKKPFKKRFRTLYEDLKREHNMIFIYQFLFLIRRLIFSLTLIFITGSGTAQLAFTQVSSLGMLIFLWVNRPFSENW